MKSTLRHLAATAALVAGCCYGVFESASLPLDPGRSPASTLLAGDVLVLGGEGGFRATVENAGDIALVLSTSINGDPEVRLSILQPGDAEAIAVWAGQTVHLRGASARRAAALRVRYRTDLGGTLPIGVFPESQIAAAHD